VNTWVERREGKGSKMGTRYFGSEIREFSATPFLKNK
jgi:hypothetical protein